MPHKDFIIPDHIAELVREEHEPITIPDINTYELVYCVPSAGRSTTAVTQSMLTSEVGTSLWFVPNEEYDAYVEKVGPNVIGHPPFSDGMSQKRTWLLDHIRGDVQVQVDDDVNGFWKQSEHSDMKTFYEPKRCDAIIRGVADMAVEMGICQFGWADEVWGGSGAKAPVCMKPFSLRSRIPGGLYGVVQAYRHGQGWDPMAEGQGDHDFFLTMLYYNKVCLRDNRYTSAGVATTGANWRALGGFSTTRTKEMEMKANYYMQGKFGSDVVHFLADGRVNLHVPQSAVTTSAKLDKEDF